MMHVVVGTDSYGCVKGVRKTVVVTMFSMVQMLPLVPLGSYYVWGPASSETEGVPLLGFVRKVALRGLPLAHVDRISVAFAYTRAILAALVLFGFIFTFMGLMCFLNGWRTDDDALIAIRVAEACLATGIAAGILAYFIPTASRRERAIRTYCGEILGVCIDPARVVPEAVAAIGRMLPPLEHADRPRSRSDYLRELVLARCECVDGKGRNCEPRTDELLDKLSHLDRFAPAQTLEAGSFGK